MISRGEWGIYRLVFSIFMGVLYQRGFLGLGV